MFISFAGDKDRTNNARNYKNARPSKLALILQCRVSMNSFLSTYHLICDICSIKLAAMSKNKDEMSFLEHLEELRWHIIRSMVGILLAAILGFVFKDFVFDTLILGPTKEDFWTYRFFCHYTGMLCKGPGELNIFTKDLGEQFLLHIKVSFVLGFIIASPYVFWEMWKFIKPGLYDQEQKLAKYFVWICSALFMIGILFGYFVVTPMAVTFLANYSLSNVIENSVTLSSLIGNLTMIVLPAGLIFELPLVIYFLAKMGLVTPEFLKKYRKHAVVIILILAAIITPPDVVTQLLVTFPLYILYEIGIYVAKYVTVQSEEK